MEAKSTWADVRKPSKLLSIGKWLWFLAKGSDPGKEKPPCFYCPFPGHHLCYASIPAGSNGPGGKSRPVFNLNSSMALRQ